MVAVSQGELWWADLPEPLGSEPGYRRPIIVIQGDLFNQSSINTVVAVLVTGNLRRANSPGNIYMSSTITGLPQDSVANITQIVTIDRRRLLERVGRLSRADLEVVLSGVDFLLGR